MILLRTNVEKKNSPSKKGQNFYRLSKAGDSTFLEIERLGYHMNDFSRITILRAFTMMLSNGHF